MSACSADISAKIDPMGLGAGVGVEGARGIKLVSVFSNLTGDALFLTVAMISVDLPSVDAFGEARSNTRGEVERE